MPFLGCQSYVQFLFSGKMKLIELNGVTSYMQEKRVAFMQKLWAGLLGCIVGALMSTNWILRRHKSKPSKTLMNEVFCCIHFQLDCK